MRFWDSSALVPLLVAEAGSSQADEWLEQDPEPVVWTTTPVELASAVRRLVRDGALEETQAHQTETRIDELFSASHVVADVEAVKAQARRLLRAHRLRAADALQLGAACEWAAGRPTGHVLHTLDVRLGRAARREGFSVLPEPAET